MCSSDLTGRAGRGESWRPLAGDEAFGHARIVVGRFRYAFDSAMRFHSKDLLLSN